MFATLTCYFNGDEIISLMKHVKKAVNSELMDMRMERKNHLFVY